MLRTDSINDSAGPNAPLAVGSVIRLVTAGLESISMCLDDAIGSDDCPILHEAILATFYSRLHLYKLNLSSDKSSAWPGWASTFIVSCFEQWLRWADRPTGNSSLGWTTPEKQRLSGTPCPASFPTYDRLHLLPLHDLYRESAPILCYTTPR